MKSSYDGARTHIVQSVSHNFLQVCVLRNTCAMTGIVYCIVGHKLLRNHPQFLFPFSVQTDFHKVEASHQDIRLRPLNNIENSPVGTPAEQNLFAALGYFQILLMTKILRDKSILSLS